MNRNVHENWEKLKQLIELRKVMEEDKTTSEIKEKLDVQGRIDTNENLLRNFEEWQESNQENINGIKKE